MAILIKSKTREIFAKEGCWTNHKIIERVDSLVTTMVTDTAKRSKRVLDSWKKKILTKDALEVAYDQHKQSHLATIIEELILKLTDLLEREGKEIEAQYRKGTQINPKAIK